MERVQENIAATRAHTDASLSVERASTDAAGDASAATARQVLDDLIEHDRIVADERLRKFRERADGALALERSASPASGGSVATERRQADKGKRAEREVTDAVLEGERDRSDAAIKTAREAQEADRAQLELHREETDDQLSTERSSSDDAVADLGETRSALDHAKSEQARAGDVLGMVTHDLRSPLCIIALSAHSITEATKEASTREAAQEVIRAASRMERLLTDLLDLARIRSGTLRLVKRPHDVGALLTEVRKSYGHLFEERGMTFDVEVPTASVVVAFDHDRIVQVLSNLLGNAMKFTPPKGSISLHVEQGPQLQVVVHNSGPGIPPDELPHVFEQFWHIDSDSRRGLGLGLYICQKILEAHGGRIWAESDVGRGATFRFTLPAN